MPDSNSSAAEFLDQPENDGATRGGLCPPEAIVELGSGEEITDFGAAQARTTFQSFTRADP